MFHQPQANTPCQNRIAKKRGGKHRDPRCSLECRADWAKLETDLLIHQLSSVKHSHNIYYGNVQIQADLTLYEHLQVRSRFLKCLREWRKQQNREIEFRACSEIGGNGRIHYHYAAYANVHVSHAAMKQLWDAACQPHWTILCHEPARSIEAISKYVFKDLKEFRERKKWVRLFAPHTIPIPWQTKGFFQPNRPTVLQVVRQSWKRKPT